MLNKEMLFANIGLAFIAIGIFAIIAFVLIATFYANLWLGLTACAATLICIGVFILNFIEDLC